jgi:hypothetical protein
MIATGTTETRDRNPVVIAVLVTHTNIDVVTVCRNVQEGIIVTITTDIDMDTSIDMDTGMVTNMDIVMPENTFVMAMVYHRV